MTSTLKCFAIAALTLLLSNVTVKDSGIELFSIAIAQTPNRTNPVQDTLIIPGVRVGAVTRNTSRKDLTKLFGAQALKDTTISGPEGIGTLAATRVNLGLQKSFTIVWTNASRTKPGNIRDLGTAWKTPEGLATGTSFAQLRQTLGEFRLSGLGWDYGGIVFIEQTRLSRYAGKLILLLDAAPDAANRFPKDYEAISGDQELSSTNSHWKPLGMRVAQMIVTLNATP